MDVSAAGVAGSPILEPPVPLSAPVAAPGPSARAVTEAHEDSVGSLLQLISAPQIHDILSSAGALRASHGAAIENHFQAAVSAVADHDLPRALTHLTEYIKLNPEHAPALITTPSLISIQGAAQELLRHITHDAKIDAERMISAAGLLVSAAPGSPGTLNGPDALAVARRFAESGQLINYIRASELSQAVIASYSVVVPDDQISALRRHLLELIRTFWRRVPLLVLLAGWFALGLVGAAVSLLARIAGAALSPATVESGFELWGMGFLALVVLQFCLSVRHALFKNQRPW